MPKKTLVKSASIGHINWLYIYIYIYMGFRATLSPTHFDLNMAFWVFVFVMVSFHEALHGMNNP
jgi:hypothetical protein